MLAHVKQIHDPERFAEYSAQTPEVIAAHGGEYLVRGGTVDPVEVDGPIGRLVVVRFPSLEAASTYYHGDAYRRLTAIRQSAADTDLLLVDGYKSGG